MKRLKKSFGFYYYLELKLKVMCTKLILDTVLVSSAKSQDTQWEKKKQNNFFKDQMVILEIYKAMFIFTK